MVSTAVKDSLGFHTLYCACTCTYKTQLVLFTVNPYTCRCKPLMATHYPCTDIIGDFFLHFKRAFTGTYLHTPWQKTLCLGKINGGF